MRGKKCEDARERRGETKSKDESTRGKVEREERRAFLGEWEGDLRGERKKDVSFGREDKGGGKEEETNQILSRHLSSTRLVVVRQLSLALLSSTLLSKTHHSTLLIHLLESETKADDETCRSRLGGRVVSVSGSEVSRRRGERVLSLERRGFGNVSEHGRTMSES